MLALFPSIVLPMFLATIDQTIVAAALPTVAAELGGAERISWVVIAYLVAVTVASPAYGRLGDLMGHKRLMLIALVILIVASVLCALAPSVELLIAARVVQGFGGGGLMTLSQALIGERVPPRERARYQSLLSGTAVSSTAFGAVVGGWLTQHFGWRSVFLVTVPVALAAMLLVRRLPEFTGERKSFRFDAFGLLLFVVFVVSSLFALRQVQEWRAEVILPGLGLLALAIVALLVLVWREKRARHPLLPIPVFSHPAIWRSDLMALCHGALLVSLMTFLPLYLSAGHGANAGQIGLALLPIVVGVSLGSIITGLLIVWTGRTAIFPSLGLIPVVVTLLLVAFFLPALNVLQLAIILGLCSVFVGTVMSVVQLTAQAAVGPDMRGTAAASVLLSRSIGATLGTAVVGVVLFATMTAADADAARMFADLLQGGTDVLSTLTAERRTAVEATMTGAFQLAFCTMAGFAVLGMIMAWTLPFRRT